MDQIGVKSGKPTFIEEINECSDPGKLIGQSVSVVGRLTMHEVSECTAKLADPSTKSDMLINTTLIEPFEARVGSLFHLIGEIESSNDDRVVLKARVVRCVDGLDLALYKKAIEGQRKYFELRSQGI